MKRRTTFVLACVAFTTACNDRPLEVSRCGQPAPVASTEPTVFSGAPSGLLNPAMAYDCARDVTLLFGGVRADETPSGETWRLAGSNWTQVATTGPSPRYSAGMAYDPVRGRVVLYGGLQSEVDPALYDTWEWDGTTWTVSSTTAPPGLSGTPDGAALVYNPVDGLIYMTHVHVFYGDGRGRAGTRWYEVVPGTWTWNGATWSRVSDSNPRLYAITYDSGRGKLVGYGDSDIWNLLGTYEWSGSSWDEITTATRVPIRFDAVFAYHPVRHKTVLIGGVVGSIIDLVPYNDIWEYDGNDWSEVSPNDTREYDGNDWVEVSPSVAPRRNDSGYSFDTARGKLVIFGGSYGEYFMVNETWTY